MTALLSPGQQLTLRSALASLGASPDAVAAALARAGATGRRGEYEDSPVGAYLNGLLAAAGLRTLRWTVGDTEAVGRFPGPPRPGDYPPATVRVPLPTAVRAFQHQFDLGGYPALDVRRVGHR